MSDEKTSSDGRETPGRRRVRPEPTATQRALTLLTRREHSRKELARKLSARGVDAAEAEAAIERLAGEGWQDDARFAESLVRSRVSNGYGPMRIRAELATHGLDREAIAAALDTFEGDWSELARDQVLRRYGGSVAEDRTLQRKAADFLIRRGFDAACVRSASRLDFDD
ncbi:recombination regulator RecX [Lysobacter korlensis]|uniref:Regulatory protein RecX n=1 Tax=Lysobacter korlensis TaxID=553636 RepID=A0ABV6RQ79_9GAMM